MEIRKLMEEIEFKIGGMTCTHCVLAVEKELKDAGFKNVQVEVGSVKLDFDGSDQSKTEIVEVIKSAGYVVIPEK